MHRLSNRIALWLFLACFFRGAATVSAGPSIVSSEFIFESAPFASCHASTIAQTKEGLVAAWFGGKREGDKSVGIWLSRHGQADWSAPVEVATGQQSDGNRFPCWNPALFQSPAGPLLLFYKVGPKPSQWWGEMKTSSDAGITWSSAMRLPEGILGPIKDKPVLLSDGTLLCPSSTEDHGWQIHMEMTRDWGKTWTKTPPLNDGTTTRLIQPTVLTLGDGNLELLCRSGGKDRHIFEARSTDNGKTWTAPTPTDLPNPNSGIDAVTLKDGRSLLIYNNTPRDRSPLNIAVSADGKTWRNVLVLEDQPGEYSYPAIIQTSDGLVHATYTWKRQRIKHVVIDAGSPEVGSSSSGSTGGHQ
ncbi:MAG TPA: sialidase family protein [Tepidisphaeraceae bacterium]|nr:sialidase family protein [Tepidisphaeraceae bacterium]